MKRGRWSHLVMGPVRVPLIICGGMHETSVSAIALLAGYNIGYVLMPEQALH
jgi:hypothetical protein